MADNTDTTPPATNAAEASAETSEATTSSVQDTAELVKKMYGLDIMEPSAEDDEVHKFWDTQPVPHLSDIVDMDKSGPIDEPKTVEDVRQEPYNLPSAFKWVSVDVSNPEEMMEVYTLLKENYVEDDDNMFRFDYSVEFLQWALTPPGYHKDWHVGVRQVNNNKLRAFITGVPAGIKVHQTPVKVTEINFLCVHKNLRSKRLAPVLIKEVTRRVNLKNVWQAVYTAGVVLPKPVGACRYYHRSLRPKKLIEVQFSRLHPRMTMNRTIKLHKVPDEPQIAGIRPFEPKYVSQAYKLVSNYLKQFKLYVDFEEDEFAHWLLPREGVVDSFVVLNNDGAVTDFASFYHLPSSVIGNDKHKTLFAAYSFYNVATSVPLKKLMTDLLIFAYKKGMDVFNALDMMENESFLKDLKFGVGDGNLQYYLYNWQCPNMESKEIGLVLL